MSEPRVLDYSAVCRACLSECTSDKLLLSDADVLVNFAICTSFRVTPEDDLPSQICKECWTKCTSWYEFRTMCEESQKVLKNTINQKSTTHHIKSKFIESNEEDPLGESSGIKDEPAEVEDILSEEINIKGEPMDEDYSIADIAEDLVDSDTFEDRSQGFHSPQPGPSGTTTRISSLSKTSQKQYDAVYNDFMKWLLTRNCSKDDINEDQLMSYYIHLSEEKGAKPTSLAVTHAILKTVLYHQHQIDLVKFTRLPDYIKERNTGYVPNKHRGLTKENIRRFLQTAADRDGLDLKVILILVLAGLTAQDVHDLVQSDVVFTNSLNEVRVEISRTWKWVRVNNTSMFPFVDILRKYDTIASQTGDRRAFLLTYKNGKCNKSIMGLNYIKSAFKTIALRLGLDNSEVFTARATYINAKADSGKTGSALNFL